MLPLGPARFDSILLGSGRFQKKTKRNQNQFSAWCPGEDSNLHASRR
jgi:hypothetical protein